MTKNISYHWRSIGALFLSSALIFSAPAYSNSTFMVTGGGGDFKVKTKTFMDRKFTQVIRQHYDFSCGSAALATLLSFHYDHPVDEMTVLNDMFEHGNKEKIVKEGFSLLDMKQYLSSIGFESDGFRESLEKLSRVGVPAIVLINKRGYLHFVVVQGVNEESVSVADPTTGVTVYSRDEFISMWNGILFVIMNQKDRAKATFNTRAAWRPYGIPQFHEALSVNDLASVTLNVAYSPGYIY